MKPITSLSRSEFKSLPRKGDAAAKGASLLVVWHDFSDQRLGLVVSAKVGNAVKRNLIQRRLRDITSSLLADKGGRWVIIVRPAAADCDFAQLQAEVESCVNRVMRRIGPMPAKVE